MRTIYIGDQLNAILQDQCQGCIKDGNPTPGAVRHHQYGPQCHRHYERTLNHFFPDKCRAEGCSVRLRTGARNNRACHCRKHERLCLELKNPKTLTSALERVAENITVNHETTCWVWNGKITKGTALKATYGLISVGTKIGACGGNGRNRDEWLAHRFMSVWAYGGHGPKRQLDHLCGNTLCCNPTHLAALTPRNHQDTTRWREQNPNRPWYEDANLNPINTRIAMFALIHGLPLRPMDTDLRTNENGSL